MSNIFNTVRATLIALTVASPALAQTPRDVANLAWQQNVPSYTASTPATPIFAGAGSAADLAALVQDNTAAISAAPNADAFATAFAAADLARLTGVAVPGQPTVTVAELAR